MPSLNGCLHIVAYFKTSDLILEVKKTTKHLLPVIDARKWNFVINTVIKTLKYAKTFR